MTLFRLRGSRFPSAEATQLTLYSNIHSVLTAAKQAASRTQCPGIPVFHRRSSQYLPGRRTQHLGEAPRSTQRLPGLRNPLLGPALGRPALRLASEIDRRVFGSAEADRAASRSAAQAQQTALPGPVHRYAAG